MEGERGVRDELAEKNGGKEERRDELMEGEREAGNELVGKKSGGREGIKG